MNFRQLAEYLDSTPGSLKVKYKSDGIPHIRYGRRVLFDRIETDRWLTSEEGESRRGGGRTTADCVTDNQEDGSRTAEDLPGRTK